MNAKKKHIHIVKPMINKEQAPNPFWNIVTLVAAEFRENIPIATCLKESFICKTYVRFTQIDTNIHNILGGLKSTHAAFVQIN